MHLSTVDSLEPSHPILRELLNLWLQLIALHIKIIHSTNPWDQHSRITARHPVHECTTYRAEIVGHGAARGDGLALSKFGELVLAANVRRRRLFDDEVGREC